MVSGHGEAAIRGGDAAGQAFAPGVEILCAQCSPAGVGAGADAAELVAIQGAQAAAAVADRHDLPRQAVICACDRAFLLVQAEGVAGGDAGAAPKG